MKNRVLKKLVYYDLLITTSLVEFEKEEVNYIEKEGLGTLDRWTKASLTRFKKELLELVILVAKELKDRGIKLNKKTAGSHVNSLTSELSDVMLLGSYGKDVDQDSVLDTGKAFAGLPEHFREFITRVIVGTYLFGYKFGEELDGEFKTRFTTLVKRITTFKKQLEDRHIIIR